MSSRIDCGKFPFLSAPQLAPLCLRRCNKWSGTSPWKQINILFLPNKIRLSKWSQNLHDWWKSCYNRVLTPTFEPNYKLGIKKSNLSRFFPARFCPVDEWTTKRVQKLVVTLSYDFETGLKLHFWMGKMELNFKLTEVYICLVNVIQYLPNFQ